MYIQTSLGRHTAAFIRATPAHFGTLPAVVHIRVLLAFRCAGFADGGTNTAQLVGVRTAEAHQLGRSAADRRAFQVELDAADHVVDVRFLQTGSRTVIADNSALQASLDAAFELLVSHDEDLTG
jgi:hypothetical protein